MIYFAGHGAPDPNRLDNLYLLPTDARLDAPASTAFPVVRSRTGQHGRGSINPNYCGDEGFEASSD